MSEHLMAPRLERGFISRHYPLFTSSTLSTFDEYSRTVIFVMRTAYFIHQLQGLRTQVARRDLQGAQRTDPYIYRARSLKNTPISLSLSAKLRHLGPGGSVQRYRQSSCPNMRFSSLHPLRAFFLCSSAEVR